MLHVARLWTGQGGTDGCCRQQTYGYAPMQDMIVFDAKTACGDTFFCIFTLIFPFSGTSNIAFVN